MLQLLTEPRARVVLIALSIILFFIFFILLNIFLFSFKRGQPIVSKGQSDLATSTWRIYQDNDLQLSYPSSWELNITRMSNNGSIVIVTPYAPDTSLVYPRIIITTDSNTPLGEKKLQFQRYIQKGFITGTIPIDGYTASKVSGTFLLYTANRGIVIGPLQQGYILVDAVHPERVIEYKYKGGTVDGATEKLILQILHTIHFIH